MTETLDHWIAGTTDAGEGSRTGPVYDPALGVVSKEVRYGTAGDIDRAVGVAKAAFADWGNSSITKRQNVMFGFREILNQRKEELAAILTSEHGKVLSDAAGEVARGLEVVEFAGHGAQDQGSVLAERLDRRRGLLRQGAVGVVGIISPFNFPAMVPMWFFPIAIATGNTVVLKPSEKDPSVANWIGAALKEAGLPDGVFNVVHGDKEAVDALLDPPRRRLDLVRRFDPDREVRLRDRDSPRQAGAGARRRQEPHAGAARRRPRPGRRRRRQRRLRLGR